MGQITTGVGLVSGLDINAIVEQLIAIESRPRNLVQQRTEVIRSQQVAFQDINARLLALKGSADSISGSTSFSGTTSSSSDESVVSVSSGVGATPGTYQFTVGRLVAAQQSITRGFQDSNATAVAPAGGTLTFDRGEARIDSETRLSNLNGGEGINRGYIRITDRSGATSLVDLRAVVSVSDVIERINTSTGTNVLAQVDGDRLTITDVSGGSGDLLITDVGTNGTATALGIAGNSTLDADGDDTVLTGTNINAVGSSTLISSLNDGKGIRTDGGSDLVINYSGGTATIDLSDLLTLGDIFDAIDAETSGVVTAQQNADGTGISLTDTGGSGVGFNVASGNGSSALVDLGLTDGQADDDADGTISGERVIASINSKLLRDLFGGAGITGIIGEGRAPINSSTTIANLFQGAGLSTTGDAAADIEILDKNGSSLQINIDGLATLGDLLDQINNDAGTDLSASITGDGELLIEDISGGTGNLTIQDLGASSAAAELGIGVQADVTSATSVNLDPVIVPAADAQITITDSLGNAALLGIGDARSVQDILDAINNAGIGVSASLNNAGNGLTITDTAGGAGDLAIADTVGSAASQLGLLGTFSDGVADSGDLDYAYVTGGARIDDLGITRGRFTITDSQGIDFTVDLTQGNELTIDDIITEINGASPGGRVTAEVNATGDGINLIDNGPGTVALSVAEEGSTTAAELGILGTAANAGDNIEGTFENVITVEATDTLQTLATKINDADVGVSASVINDGSPGAPFRLSLSSDDAGTDGAFVFDDGGLGLNTITLSQAQDAVVFYGGNDPSKSIAVESKSNTLSSIIPGADISLLSVSDQPVTVTIALDDDAIIDRAGSLADTLNGVFDTLDRYDSYNADTEERGLLLGDSTVQQIRSRLYNVLIQPNNELTGQYTSLSQIGIRVGSGARVDFDQDKFTTALQTDRDAVEALLTFEQFEIDPDTGEDTDVVAAQGVGVEISKLLTRLTDSIDGVVQSKLDTLDSQVQLNEDRIEELDIRLEAKRQRLLAEFQAMESALAQLQDQSSSLGQIQQISAPQSSG
ncbi:MAG: flagellar filament capping protein FliD [Phycisphaeraceae bacterium]|nr:flagellar filament capping protein FliD [Phycisphaeraceae bacterium]